MMDIPATFVWTAIRTLLGIGLVKLIVYRGYGHGRRFFNVIRRIVCYTIMIISDIMVEKAFTLSLDDTAAKAQSIMHENNINQLPVVDNEGKYRGMIFAKGFLNLDGCKGPVVVQFVQHLAPPPVELEYWPTMDPTAVEGSRNQRLDAYRAVRDELMRRIQARFAADRAGDV